MKKIFLSFLMFAVVLSITSCKNSSSPSDVAVSFAKAMLTQDTATARRLATKESSEFFQTGNMDAAPDSILTIFKAAQYKASELKTIGDSASVKITTTLSKEIFGQKENILICILKKENGQWKVDLASTMRKAMEGMMPESGTSTLPADSSGMSPLPTAPDSAEK